MLQYSLLPNLLTEVGNTPKKKISVPKEVKATRAALKNKHKENARVWKNWLITVGNMRRMKQSMLGVCEEKASVTSPSFPVIQSWQAGTNWIKIKTAKGKGETTLFISFHICHCEGIPGEVVQCAIAWTHSCSPCPQAGESHLEAGQSR